MSNVSEGMCDRLYIVIKSLSEKYRKIAIEIRLILYQFYLIDSLVKFSFVFLLIFSIVDKIEVAWAPFIAWSGLKLLVDLVPLALCKTEGRRRSTQTRGFIRLFRPWFSVDVPPILVPLISALILPIRHFLGLKIVCLISRTKTKLEHAKVFIVLTHPNRCIATRRM